MRLTPRIPPLNRWQSIGKALERSNKRVWHAVLRRVMRNPPLLAPIDPSTVRRVLFLRYDNVGDMITTIPALHLLRRQNAALEIDVMASAGNRAIVDSDPAVSSVRVLPRRADLFVREIIASRRRRYDVVVCCLFARATAVGLIANWIAPRGVKTTIWRAPEHAFLFSLQSKTAAAEPTMWEKMVRLVTETFECHDADHGTGPCMVIPPSSQDRARAHLAHLGVVPGTFVLVNITSARERNRWTEAGFGETIRAMLADGEQDHIVLLAMGEDREMAARLASASSTDDRVHVYPPTPDVLEVAALVEHAELVVSLDTGVIHMASAAGTPVVGLYVSDEQGIREWRPYEVPHRIVASPTRGAPVAAIPPREVIKAAKGLLGEIRAAS